MGWQSTMHGHVRQCLQQSCAKGLALLYSPYSIAASSSSSRLPIRLPASSNPSDVSNAPSMDMAGSKLHSRETVSDLQGWLESNAWTRHAMGVGDAEMAGLSWGRGFGSSRRCGRGVSAPHTAVAGLS